ncbi:MAG: cysteine hydrolase [Deltaproteobacteria bacterium]|nr:cysteine hydrolase [Deltaproteobacteria bacterium]
MNRALVVVDVQNDYFPGGRMPLEGSVEAARQAGRALTHFRERGLPVIHVQHVSDYHGARFFLPETEGVKINEAVAPLPGEAVFTKRYPNAFRDTPLLEFLREHQVRRLVVCGMMTHMCVDATVRAAFDHGFACILLSDACATRSLEYKTVSVPAGQVTAAFMAALGQVYAKVLDLEEFLADESTPSEK